MEFPNWTYRPVGSPLKWMMVSGQYLLNTQAGSAGLSDLLDNVGLTWTEPDLNLCHPDGLTVRK